MLGRVPGDLVVLRIQEATQTANVATSNHYIGEKSRLLLTKAPCSVHDGRTRRVGSDGVSVTHLGHKNHASLVESATCEAVLL